jgi:hypothetical protein
MYENEVQKDFHHVNIPVIIYISYTNMFLLLFYHHFAFLS